MKNINFSINIMCILMKIKIRVLSTLPNNLYLINKVDFIWLKCIPNMPKLTKKWKNKSNIIVKNTTFLINMMLNFKKIRCNKFNNVFKEFISLKIYFIKNFFSLFIIYLLTPVTQIYIWLYWFLCDMFKNFL